MSEPSLLAEMLGLVLIYGLVLVAAWVRGWVR